MPNFYEIWFFLLGLVVGSFLNVCIYRLPRNCSIISPPSSCPKCNNPIKVIDNIPIISYVFLRGRCRYCKERISIRYPFVELLNGILYWAVFSYFGLGWHLPFLFAFCSSMIVISFIDLDFQIIPDVITLPGIIIGLFGASFFIPDIFGSSIVGFKTSLLGFLIGGGLFYLIAVLSKGGIGGGDIKMMAMIGAFLGWKAVLLTTFIGSLAGSIVGVFLMVFKGMSRKTKIPFGPFLAFGALITLFFGRLILDWYLQFK